MHNQVKLLAELTGSEESFLKQKSRVYWLKEGDQNTRYFFNVVRGKTSQSKVRALKCADGRDVAT